MSSCRATPIVREMVGPCYGGPGVCRYELIGARIEIGEGQPLELNLSIPELP